MEVTTEEQDENYVSTFEAKRIDLLQEKFLSFINLYNLADKTVLRYTAAKAWVFSLFGTKRIVYFTDAMKKVARMGPKQVAESLPELTNFLHKFNEATEEANDQFRVMDDEIGLYNKRYPKLDLKTSFTIPVFPKDPFLSVSEYSKNLKKKAVDFANAGEEAQNAAISIIDNADRTRKSVDDVDEVYSSVLNKVEQIIGEMIKKAASAILQSVIIMDNVQAIYKIQDAMHNIHPSPIFYRKEKSIYEYNSKTHMFDLQKGEEHNSISSIGYFCMGIDETIHSVKRDWMESNG